MAFLCDATPPPPPALWLHCPCRSAVSCSQHDSLLEGSLHAKEKRGGHQVGHSGVTFPPSGMFLGSAAHLRKADWPLPEELLGAVAKRILEV